MTLLLTPDRDPFLAATYLPRAALQDLAGRVREAWRTRPEQLRAQARRIAAHVAAAAEVGDLPPFGGSDRDLLAVLEGTLRADADPMHGGWGGRPKFPPHAELLFLLERARADWDRGEASPEDLRHLRRTLAAMEEGGIHDQVGGGFHRYSTDERWLLPHFEKMLYDNALLARAYAEAAAATGERRFGRVARRTLAWVRRDLARPEGGYASSLDADTGGEEGRTYTWTAEEVRAALPAADRDLALRWLGVREEGNFEDEATGHPTGRNVLHLPRPLAEAAEGMDLAAAGDRLESILRHLAHARAGRSAPALDEKVIVAWNGLLLSAFAAVGSALADPEVLEEGRRLAAWLLSACRGASGALLRFPAASGAEIVGFAEDHVHLAEGLLDLSQATGEGVWAAAARDLADRLLERFEDRAAGGFWSTGARPACSFASWPEPGTPATGKQPTGRSPRSARSSPRHVPRGAWSGSTGPLSFDPEVRRWPPRAISRRRRSPSAPNEAGGGPTRRRTSGSERPPSAAARAVAVRAPSRAPASPRRCPARSGLPRPWAGSRRAPAGGSP
jgi:hypothetical protein